MKLTFITNATCIIEDNNFKILCDPWFTPGAFEGAWYHYPELKHNFKDVADVDCIYVSHLHEDHYDKEFLSNFRKDIPIIILDDEHYNFLEKLLRKIGFTNLISLKDEESTEIGGMKVTMFRPFTGNLFHETKVGNLIDTAILVESGEFSIFNTNDNRPTIEAAERITAKYGKFSMVLLAYNMGSAYPSCFNNLSIEQKTREHQKMIERGLDYFTRLTNIFQSKYIVPFAGDFLIGGKQWQKNAVIGATTWDHAVEYAMERGIPSVPIVLNEGLTFDLKEGKIVNGEYAKVDLEDRNRYIEEVLAKKLYPFEKEDLNLKEISKWLIEHLPKARENLFRKQRALDCLPNCNFYLKLADDYFYFNFDNPNSQILPLNTKLVQPYLVAEMDLRLLRSILRRDAHWNNAEGGLHVDFIRDPNVYLPDVHVMLSFFHLPVEL